MPCQLNVGVWTIGVLAAGARGMTGWGTICTAGGSGKLDFTYGARADFSAAYWLGETAGRVGAKYVGGAAAAPGALGGGFSGS